VAYGLRVKRLAEAAITKAVHEVLGLVGLGGYDRQFPNQLSGGEQQRVALARAIVIRPRVLLFDEPLSNLDAKLRVEARTFISKLHQRLGTTFIYVTHDQVEAMTMGQRIAVLNAGKLMQIDTPTNLYDHPHNVFVAGFIGSPSMNFFDNCVMTQEGSTLYIDTGYFRVVVPESRQELYRSHVGKKVVFGIRPENIAHADFVMPGIVPAPVEANVDVVEEMGNEKILYLEEGGKTFLARIDPRADVRVGQRLTVVLNMDVMHLFDADTEQALQ
jgi:multiple sugar transport system ATP-binding protein